VSRVVSLHADFPSIFADSAPFPFQKSLRAEVNECKTSSYNVCMQWIL
jgi:hypothetical protein